MSTRATTTPNLDWSPAGDTPNSNFLPSDKDYRLTGTMPAAESEPEEKESPEEEGEHQAASKEDAGAGAATEEKEEQENESENHDASAASSSKAAASETATRQKESRWQKRERELKEARAEIARLKARPNDAQPPHVESRSELVQDSQPGSETKKQAAATAKPKIDDVDLKTGKPKYANYGEYEDARDQWNREEAIREFQRSSEKSTKEQQEQQAEQVIQRTVQERVTAARKTYADYDDVLKSALAEKDEHGQDALFYTKRSHLDGFFLDSDRGLDVMYAIAKDFGKHKHIFARDAQGKYLLNPIRQLRELAKIENSLAAPRSDKPATASSAKPITQAPRPPHQTSGKGTVGKDSVEQAIEEHDQETYNREMNARALAKLGKNKGK